MNEKARANDTSPFFWVYRATLFLPALALAILSACAGALPTGTPAPPAEPTAPPQEAYSPLLQEDCLTLAERLSARFGEPTGLETAPFTISGEPEGEGCRAAWQGRETAFHRASDPAEAAKSVLLEAGWFDEFSLPAGTGDGATVWMRNESGLCRIHSTLDQETDPDRPVYSLTLDCAANPLRWSSEYLPLRLDDCEAIRREAMDVLGLDFDEALYARIQDPIGQRDGTSCRIERVSRGLAVRDQEEGYARLKRAFELQGWVEDPTYSTAWPTGVQGAVRRNGRLGIIRIEWHPDATDCPSDSIAVDCGIAAEHQVYSITLDFVKLPFEVKE